jgi:hypothetical protein
MAKKKEAEMGQIGMKESLAVTGTIGGLSLLAGRPDIALGAGIISAVAIAFASKSKEKSKEKIKKVI